MIIWYPVLFCLYLSSPILLRKLIVLKTYLWMLPFIWNMSRLYRLIVAWEIKQKLHKILMLRFFGTPCIIIIHISAFQNVISPFFSPPKCSSKILVDQPGHGLYFPLNNQTHLKFLSSLANFFPWPKLTKYYVSMMLISDIPLPFS